jgi:hypothetical protein
MARITGLFYLLMMLPGGLAGFVRGGLFVSGDAASFERATGGSLTALRRIPK